MESHSSIGAQTVSLLNLFANPVIFDHLIQYLPLQTTSRLSRTSSSFRDFVFTTPKVFRYLDLSKCKGAYIPTLAPIDSGGHSWRAERMDEGLTEDEFYAGPLRGVLSKLRQKDLLQHVQTLVLDGLASVTNDLLHEIMTDSDYNVRLLSIRKCVNVNPVKLQQLLRFICRPDRPENTPRLQGLYVFTDPAKEKESEIVQTMSGVTLSDGAALGILPVDKSQRQSLNMNPWYAPTGRIIEQGSTKRTSWEETLLACQNIIAFDAVLCSHMHEAMSGYLHDASLDFLTQEKPGIPPIATIALGPDGCTGCGRAPDGTPVWGQSEMYEFPLLSPPPHSGRLVDAVRPPLRRTANKFIPFSTYLEPQRLVVSCSWCLANRHCDSCHRWWCSDCYNPKKTKKLSDLEALSHEGLTNYLPSRDELSMGSGSGTQGDSVKTSCIHNNQPHFPPHQLSAPPVPIKPAVTRECWDCGRVCSPCAQVASRQCRRCKSSYCIWHNDGCDEKTCDWCMYRSGRGSKELY